MKEQYKLRALMLQEFQANRNAVQATENICRQLGDKAVNVGTVRTWFKKFRDGDTNLRNKNDPDYDKPLVIDNSICLTSNKSVLFTADDWRITPEHDWGSRSNLGLTTNNGRIAFAFSSSIHGPNSSSHRKSFVVVDLFHGRIAEIPLHHLPLNREKNCFYCLKIVDDEQLLLTEQEKGGPIMHVFLLRFDFGTLRSSVIHQVQKDTAATAGTDILLQPDSNNFVLQNRGLAWLGKVNNGGIVVEDDSIQLSHPLYCMKRADNKISGLRILDGACQFVEHNAETQKEESTVPITMLDRDNKQLGWKLDDITAYHWTKDGLYVAVHQKRSSDALLYFLGKADWTWMKLNHVVVGRVSSMFVDKNGFLTMCAFENSGVNSYRMPLEGKCQNTVYRYALKKPDSLINLAWFAVRFNHNFRGSDVYERLSQRLPFNSYLRCVLPEV